MAGASCGGEPPATRAKCVCEITESDDCVPVNITCGSSNGCLIYDPQITKTAEESVFCDKLQENVVLPPGGEASVGIDRRTNRVVYVSRDVGNFEVTFPQDATVCNLKIDSAGRASSVSLECEFDDKLIFGTAATAQEKEIKVDQAATDEPQAGKGGQAVRTTAEWPGREPEKFQ